MKRRGDSQGQNIFKKLNAKLTILNTAFLFYYFLLQFQELGHHGPQEAAPNSVTFP